VTSELLIESKSISAWGMSDMEVVLILLTGSSTYLKKFQLINSINMEIMLANKKYKRVFPNLLKNPSSSSV
jgi:hypothetical protein